MRGRVFCVGAGLLTAGLLALIVPVSALADVPTLAVKLNKLPGGSGYTVTAALSSSAPYCAVDPTATGPDLTWSQSPNQDPGTGGLSDTAGDASADDCAATSWTTGADTPFGADDVPAGTWYFQVGVPCAQDGTDLACQNGTEYSNVVSLTVPAAGGSGNSGGGSGGSGGGSGGSGGGSGSGGNGGKGGGGSGSGSTACSGNSVQAQQCRINKAYQQALAKCPTNKGKQKTHCRAAALANYQRKLAELKCRAKKGAAKKACLKHAGG